jgi:hypothetical protein
MSFNFDGVLVLLFLAYLVYGYLSGGHKQLRLSINLILPFVILYYLGPAITTYIYLPLTETFFFEIVARVMGIARYTITMITAYLITYIGVFTGIFVLSIYARRHLLNENMRAKLGRKNNYLGAITSLVNGYVLVYFIVLPAFSINLVSDSARLTNFVLDNPPPFSRIARTAEKAVPIKYLSDKAEAFQELLSVEGIEEYYNEAIRGYQLEYMGASDSLESLFMANVYVHLTDEAKAVVDDTYADLFGMAPSMTDYYGISYALVQETDGQPVYETMLDHEDEFQDIYAAQQAIVADYEAELAQFDIDLENYEFQLELDQYQSELDDYLDALSTHLDAKLDAWVAGTTPTDFAEERPTLDVDYPDSYEPIDTTAPPVDPSTLADTEVLAALDYVERYEDKVDIREELEIYGADFLAHRGFLTWLVEDLGGGTNQDPGVSDISSTIVSFKGAYDEIIDDIDDAELADKLYLAQMAIRSYDVFTLWLDCATDNIGTVPLEDIPLSNHRCDVLDPALVTEYNFANDAIDVVATLFQGDSVSWIITQFKYDYDAGLFDEHFTEFPEVQAVLLDTKSLVDEYDAYYKDIATSIEGNISMLLKIGISVLKYNMDIYETLETTPMLAAVFNDAARLCAVTWTDPVYDVSVCQGSGGTGGIFAEATNMRYLIAEIYLKAYFMVDENNERIVYDTATMQAFLTDVDNAVQDRVIARDVVAGIANQFAFHVIDEGSGTTLLEQMYADGYISIEAMRVLSDDEYDLFDDAFRFKVRSLIR